MQTSINKLKTYKTKGFTLIEAMIAVVVFSFGLLGIAGVMSVAVKNNHNGYMRSQAAFLASSITDMMRRNQIALWSDQYNGSYSGYASVASDCVSSGCAPQALANRDVQQWSNMITQILPNSSGTIECTANASPLSTFPQMIIDPLEPLVPNDPGYPSLPLVPCLNCAYDPFDGFCTVTVSWSESNEISANSSQTYTLQVKP